MEPTHGFHPAVLQFGFASKITTMGGFPVIRSCAALLIERKSHYFTKRCTFEKEKRKRERYKKFKEECFEEFQSIPVVIFEGDLQRLRKRKREKGQGKRQRQMH